MNTLMGTNMERKMRSAAQDKGPVRRARTSTADRDLTARLRSQFSSVNSFNDRDNTIANRDLAKVLRISLGIRKIKKKQVCLAVRLPLQRAHERGGVRPQPP